MLPCCLAACRWEKTTLAHVREAIAAREGWGSAAVMLQCYSAVFAGIDLSRGGVEAFSLAEREEKEEEAQIPVDEPACSCATYAAAVLWCCAADERDMCRARAAMSKCPSNALVCREGSTVAPGADGSCDGANCRVAA